MTVAAEGAGEMMSEGKWVAATEDGLGSAPRTHTQSQAWGLGDSSAGKTT